MHKGIYKASNGSWYISTKVKGKTCTIRGFTSRKEAEDNYEYEIELWKKKHGVFSVSSDVWYEDVVKEYMEHKERIVTHETARKDQTQFDTFWNIRFAHDTIKNVFNLDRLRIIYKNLIDDENFSAKKKYHIVRTFRDFTTYCYDYHYIADSMLHDVLFLFQKPKLLKQSSATRRFIPENEINALLSVIPSESEYLVMFQTFVFLGARINEFLGICVDCFDYANDKIEIKRQLEMNGKLTSRLKTAQSYRKILLPHELSISIKDYIIRYKRTERIFPISNRTFHRLLSKYETLANIPQYVPHEFRHTKATNLASKCKDVSDVVYCANILGHSSSMFLNTYCHSMGDEKGKKFL